MPAKSDKPNSRGNVLLLAVGGIFILATISIFQVRQATTHIKSLRKLIQNTEQLVSSEVAALQSYYEQTAPTGSVDAEGRYASGVNLNYSQDLPPGLDASLPSNSLPSSYDPGDPLNIAQTMQLDNATSVISYSRGTLRYRPVRTLANGDKEYCGMVSYGEELFRSYCLVDDGSGAVGCTPEICSATTIACLETTKDLPVTLIETEAELRAIRADTPGNFKLANNIALSADLPAVWEMNNSIFDGAGFTISQLNGTRTTVGLITDIYCSFVTNLILSAGTIGRTSYSSNAKTGALAGSIHDSTISGVQVLQGTIHSTRFGGGLAGRLIDSTVLNSHSSANIFNYQVAGGLIGQTYGNSQITQSYATGNVTLKVNNQYPYTYAGGLVGITSADTQITECYATGNAISVETGYAGGLVGSTYAGPGKITRSYATGNATAGESGTAGGLVGILSKPVEDCYATGNVSGKSRAGGLIGAVHAEVRRSWASGNVSGCSWLGAFAGQSSNAEISDSFAIGDIHKTCESGFKAGGFVSAAANSTVNNSFVISKFTCTDCSLFGFSNPANTTETNCYWNITPETGTTYTNFASTGTEKTPAEMQQQSTFTGFNFNTIWQILPGQPPALQGMPNPYETN